MPCEIGCLLYLLANNQQHEKRSQMVGEMHHLITTLIFTTDDLRWIDVCCFYSEK